MNTLSKLEFEERLIEDVGCEIKHGFTKVGDIYYPVSELHELTVYSGYFEALKRIREIEEEAAILDRLLDNPKESEIFPLMEVEEGKLVPRIYAHAKGKYICRVKEAEGSLEKAKKNLKRKFPLKTYTSRDAGISGTVVTVLYTESPFLTASHILLNSFPEDYVIIPNQGIIYLVPPEKDMDREEERDILLRAMILSGADYSPPSKKLDYISPPEKW